MRVSVAYAEPGHQEWLEVEVPEGTTAEGAVRLSGIRERFPHLTLEDKELGVFSKPVPRDRVLREGDRVEIYRPLRADPKKARTRQARGEGAYGEGAGGAWEAGPSGAGESPGAEGDPEDSA